MGDHGASEFGKDNGLVHEVVVKARKLGLGRDFWKKMLSDEDLLKGIAEVYCGTSVIVSNTYFIKPRASSVHSRVHRFSADDKFGLKDHGKCEFGVIAYTQHFREVFGGYVCSDVPETTIRSFDLLRDSLDQEILAALGGQKAVKLDLSQLYRFLESQDRGQKLMLLVDGTENVFYIPDNEGTLWAVTAHWRCDKWHLDVWRVGVEDRWELGTRIFSRDPHPKSLATIAAELTT